MSDAGYFTGRMSLREPIIAVKALKEARRTDPNQRPRLIVYSSTF